MPTTIQSPTSRTKKNIKKASVANPKTKKGEAKKDLSETYNEFKQFEGQQYTGMKVGRGHHWHYDQGDWKETKITPDLWEISYAVTKRRTGHAPEGSGVPVGTEYHWYILSHQNVRKLNANDYSTAMTGLKFKLAHKRADKEKWSVSAATQRKHLVSFLKDMIVQLEKDPVPIEFEYNGKFYKGEGIPIAQTCAGGFCSELEIILNDANLGIIRHLKSGWKMDRVEDKKFLKAIGQQIMVWFEKNNTSSQ